MKTKRGLYRPESGVVRRLRVSSFLARRILRSGYRVFSLKLPWRSAVFPLVTSLSRVAADLFPHLKGMHVLGRCFVSGVVTEGAHPCSILELSRSVCLSSSKQPWCSPSFDEHSCVQTVSEIVGFEGLAVVAGGHASVLTA